MEFGNDLRRRSTNAHIFHFSIIHWSDWRFDQLHCHPVGRRVNASNCSELLNFSVCFCCSFSMCWRWGYWHRWFGRPTDRSIHSKAITMILAIWKKHCRHRWAKSNHRIHMGINQCVSSCYFNVCVCVAVHFTSRSRVGEPPTRAVIHSAHKLWMWKNVVMMHGIYCFCVCLFRSLFYACRWIPRWLGWSAMRVYDSCNAVSNTRCYQI